ncbi:translation initiation factor IF-2, mitochondrial-like [Teleopsis dalmanni]|uniref:translation initiation factor IF-2, mitochondrial-like n=1 Tax=Teleopsis dalmanni TaxID=139649 RepID=UPI0018CEF222|nr:translation initiation factor IF-2, mitochondrial-like [Teleopsis dalmanni]
MLVAVLRTCARQRSAVYNVQSVSAVRCLFTTQTRLKRRKVGEEKKSDRIIEYSPKKKNVVDIWRYMTVDELAQTMSRPLEDIQEAMLFVKNAKNIEPEATLEDIKIIQEIVSKCGSKTRIVPAPDNKIETEKIRDITPRPPAPPEAMQIRSPVVTVMGHVDHGKTTLLDTLRGSAVAAGEAGGITQHIGAFTVTLENGEKVTFLDTPGHAAFSAMRARGANVTDIIVLVVAAEDGVMAQTKEVVKLAQDAKVPIIVAINKIDKPEANIEKTKRDLMMMGLVPEDKGGDVQVIPISALKGTNLELLAEAVSTQATLMGLKADYTGLVEGVVVESKTDARRGNENAPTQKETKVNYTEINIYPVGMHNITEYNKVLKQQENNLLTLLEHTHIIGTPSTPHLQKQPLQPRSGNKINLIKTFTTA